jgi:hypothetical protein
MTELWDLGLCHWKYSVHMIIVTLTSEWNYEGIGHCEKKVSPFCSAYYFTWEVELKNEPTVESFDNGATCNTSRSTRTLNCSKNIYDVGRVVGERCQAEAHCACAWQHPTTFHVWKTRGCQCSFRLLMMGGVSPETCWASYKYGIIKFWYIVATCWIFLYELCYDERIYEHQVSVKLKYLLLRKECGLRMFMNGAEEKQQKPRETCVVIL